MATSTRTCLYSLTSAVLAAATPRTFDIPINGATNWNIVLANTGANPITAITLASSPNGALFGLAVAIVAVPVAAGASLATIDGLGEPIITLRIIITSALGSTVSIEAGGY